MKWKTLCIAPDASLLDALRVIDRAAQQTALVVDEESRLLGLVGDGDIRRALLNGYEMSSPVVAIMTKKPVTVHKKEGYGVALARLHTGDLRHIPVLDEDERLCDFWTLENLLAFNALPNEVIIMAGGLGTRLGELTKDTPKPMLPIGGQPLLGHILRHFIEQGFRRFIFCVNFKAEMVRDYFRDGSHFGVSITYVHEKKRLGTAGALSLLDHEPEAPFIVINGDILTRLNFSKVLDSHDAHHASATMVVKRQEIQVPYGVVKTDVSGFLEELQEKPRKSFPICTGINVLSPETLSIIPKNTFFDMPDLFLELKRLGKRPWVYETKEYWLDIGRINDYRRADVDMSDWVQNEMA